jgi:hypothetical protein
MRRFEAIQVPGTPREFQKDEGQFRKTVVDLKVNVALNSWYENSELVTCQVWATLERAVGLPQLGGGGALFFIFKSNQFLGII